MYTKIGKENRGRSEQMIRAMGRSALYKDVEVIAICPQVCVLAPKPPFYINRRMRWKAMSTSAGFVMKVITIDAAGATLVRRRKQGAKDPRVLTTKTTLVLPDTVRRRDVLAVVSRTPVSVVPYHRAVPKLPRRRKPPLQMASMCPLAGSCHWALASIQKRWASRHQV